MNNYQLERSAKFLDNALDEINSYKNIIDDFIDEVERLEKSEESLADKINDLENKVYDLETDLAERIQENIELLEIIKSLQK